MVPTNLQLVLSSKGKRRTPTRREYVEFDRRLEIYRVPPRIEGLETDFPLGLEDSLYGTLELVDFDLLFPGKAPNLVLSCEFASPHR